MVNAQFKQATLQRIAVAKQTQLQPHQPRRNRRLGDQVSQRIKPLPKQIAQVSSYVKSLRGTKPANAREPQGTLYTEDATAAPADTTAKKAGM